MIHYQDERVTLHHANCLDVLAGMDDNSVNYGLGSLNDKHGKMSTHHGDTGGGSRFFPVFDTDDPPLFNIDEAI